MKQDGERRAQDQGEEPSKDDEPSKEPSKDDEPRNCEEANKGEEPRATIMSRAAAER